jgi:site-specific recombinase XerD
MGGRPLAKIRPLEILSLYKEMQERGLSARTVRYTNAVLHSAFSQAVKWRMLAQNPTECVDLPRQARTEMKVLSPDETRRFLEEAKENFADGCVRTRAWSARCRWDCPRSI